MTDPFLTACAAALPMEVLELIFKKVLYQTVVEHPYITEAARKAKCIHIRQAYRVEDIVMLPERHGFADGGNPMAVIDIYYDSEAPEASNAPKASEAPKAVDTLIVQSPSLSITISKNDARNNSYWDKCLTEETVMEWRKELATLIVVLHKMFPNRLTGATPFHYIYDAKPDSKTMVVARFTTLHRLFHLPIEEWETPVVPKRQRFGCVVM